MPLPAAFRQELSDIPLLEDPGSLRMHSRDFFWFSPILKEALEGKRAELVTIPRDRRIEISSVPVTFSVQSQTFGKQVHLPQPFRDSGGVGDSELSDPLGVA